MSAIVIALIVVAALVWFGSFVRAAKNYRTDKFISKRLGQ